MMKFVTTMIVVMGLVGMNAQAADLTVPNTFTAGTPASADQVNENFTAITTYVNANGAAAKQHLSPVLKGADGSLLGVLVGFAAIPNVGSQYSFVTPTGYLGNYLLKNGGGEIQNAQNLWFTTSDCTGDGYILANEMPMPGMIYGTPSGQVFYVSKTPVVESVTINSEVTGGYCSQYATSTFDAYRARVATSAQLGISLSAGSITGTAQVVMPQ